MKVKRLIKFYFSAESLNKTLDNLIATVALKSDEWVGNGEKCAEKICGLISAKDRLQELWAYLDGVMEKLTLRDRDVLRLYGGLRVGIKRFPVDEAREIRRAAVKFSRHAVNVGRFTEGVRLVNSYYCIFSCPSDVSLRKKRE